MDDLIRRQDALDDVEKVDWYHINERGELVAGANSREDEPLYKAKDIHDAIENVKPVQPNHNVEVGKMEIVHCKDCKYYGRVDKRRFYRGSDCLNNHIATIVPDRDFCSRAERRGESE